MNIKLVILFLIAAATAAQQRIVYDNNTIYFANAIVVKVKNASVIDEINRSVKSLQAESYREIFGPSKSKLLKGSNQLENIYQLNYSSGESARAVARKIMSVKGVEWAEPKYIRRIAYEPNDSVYVKNAQQNLKRIFANAAWDVTKGDTNVVIAIIDSGVEWKHPDLQANIFVNRKEIIGNGIDDDDNGNFPEDLHGWDFGGEDGIPDNDSSEDFSASNGYHGTHVAGIAGAVTNNTIGIASVGYNCRILPVKTSRHDLRDEQGYPLIAYGYEGIKYAADKGAKVINCSWGGYGFSRFEQEVIDYAVSKGALVVAAAGNKYTDLPFYPASYAGVLSVGWLNTESDDRYIGGTYGTMLDVMAPGIYIPSTWPQPGTPYRSISGSSMSTPHAAGLAGLVFSVFPNYTPLQVAEQMRATSDNIDSQNPGYEMMLGKGRINAFRAVTETNTRSMRATKINFIDGANRNGILQSGEEVAVEVEFTNYLSPLTGVNVVFQTDDSFISVVNSSFFINSIETLGIVENAGPEFIFKVADDAPINHEVKFLLRFESAGYSDFQWAVIRLNPAFDTHNSGKIAMSVTSKGALGFNDYSSNTEGIGFRYLNSENLMFEGAFLYGNAPGRMMDVARITSQQSNDFKIITPIVIKSPSVHAIQEGSAVFNDDGAGSDKLGITTYFYSYSFNLPPDDSYIILRSALNNRTENEIQNLYVGYFVDWDMPEDDFMNNITGWDEINRIAYAYNTKMRDLYVGVALISEGLPGYYGINNRATTGSIIMNNGFTDDEKWIAISGGINAGVADPGDISMVASGGPFKIPAGGTINVAFAFAAGTSLSEVRAAINQSRIKYRSIPTSLEDKQNELPVETSLYQNYPNPFNQGTVISYSIRNGGWVSLKIYDLLGRQVVTVVDQFQQTGNYSKIFDASSLASGVYYYTLRTGQFSETKRMILLK